MPKKKASKNKASVASSSNFASAKMQSTSSTAVSFALVTKDFKIMHPELQGLKTLLLSNPGFSDNMAEMAFIYNDYQFLKNIIIQKKHNLSAGMLLNIEQQLFNDPNKAEALSTVKTIQRFPTDSKEIASIIAYEFYCAIFNESDKKIKQHYNNVIKLSADLINNYSKLSSEPNLETQKIYHSGLSFLVNLCKVSSILLDKEFQNSFIKALIKLREQDLAIELYTDLCEKAILCSSYEEVLCYASRAINIYETTPDIPKIGQGMFYYYSGKYTYNLKEALNYYIKAEKYAPDLDNIFKGQYIIYMELENYQKSIEVAEKLNSNLKIKELLILRAKLSSKYLSPEDTEKAVNKVKKDIPLDSDEQRQYYFDIMIDLNLMLSNYNEVQKYIKLSLENSFNNTKSTLTLICNYLLTFVAQEKFKEGLESLENFYKVFPILKKPHSNAALKYSEFIIYENNEKYEEATAKLKELNYLKDQGPLASDAAQTVNQIRFYTLIEKEKFDEARICLEYMYPYLDQPSQDYYKELLENSHNKYIEKISKKAEDGALDNLIIEKMNLKAEKTSASSSSNSSSSSTSDKELFDIYADPKFNKSGDHKNAVERKKMQVMKVRTTKAFSDKGSSGKSFVDDLEVTEAALIVKELEKEPSSTSSSSSMQTQKHQGKIQQEESEMSTLVSQLAIQSISSSYLGNRELAIRPIEDQCSIGVVGANSFIDASEWLCSEG